MNYNKVYTQDFVNGLGVGVSLFVQGCDRANCGNPCPGCFNQATWDPDGGKLFSVEVQNKIMQLLEPDYISHLSILGGEPLDPRNIAPLTNLCNQVKLKYPNKKIWLWTGHTFEELWHSREMNGKSSLMDLLLSRVDVLVDGPYVESQKHLAGPWVGSGNQRVLDCKQSMKQKKAVLLQQ